MSATCIEIESKGGLLGLCICEFLVGLRVFSVHIYKEDDKTSENGHFYAIMTKI